MNEKSLVRNKTLKIDIPNNILEIIDTQKWQNYNEKLTDLQSTYISQKLINRQEINKEIQDQNYRINMLNVMEIHREPHTL